MFVESVKNEDQYQAMQIVNEQNYLNFKYKRKSGLLLNISLSKIRWLNRYEDVDHIGENRIVLESDPRSNMYYLKKPLTHIINNYCRHPLPNSYYVTMDSFGNRMTSAETETCSKTSFLFQSKCPKKYPIKTNIRYRSINKPCMKQIGGALLVIKDNTPHLSMERNSFYCSRNTPIVKLFTNSLLADKMEFYQDSNCESYRKLCDQCLKVHCGIRLTNIENSWCGKALQCLIQLPCINFYNQKCNENNDICLKGTTLKFTLTPEFVLTENTYQCHLKKIVSHKVPFAEIEIQISIPGLEHSIVFMKHLSITDLLMESFRSFAGFIIQYSSNLNFDYDVILQSFNNSFVIRHTNTPQTILDQKIKLSTHQTQKYAKLQMLQPFYYNSETWYNESCDIDTSQFINFDKFFNDERSKKVRLRNNFIRPKKLNGKFIYELINEDQEDIFEITLEKKTSILNPIFCQQRYKSGLLTEIKFKLTRISKRQFLLKVSGYVSDILSYLNLTLSKHQDLLQQLDIVIYGLSFKAKKGNHFWLEFQITIKEKSTSNKFSPFLLTLYLSDCKKTFIRYINIEKQSESTIKLKMDLNSSVIFEFPSHLEVFSISPTAKIFGWASIIIVLMFIIFLITVRTFRWINSFELSLFSANEKSSNSKITMKKKSIIIIYIIIRIIYSFLFTFTTILSLVLALKNEHDLKTISKNNFSSYSLSENLHSFNESFIINCSNNVKINLNNYLEKFQKKRSENNEIFYKSRQSIQNETIGAIMIFHTRLKRLTDNQKNVISNAIISNNNIYRHLYLNTFYQIIHSTWFKTAILIANNSKSLYERKFNDLIWQKKTNLTNDKIRFLELINISEIIFSMESAKLLEEKLKMITEIPIDIIKIPPIEIPKLHINKSFNFRYMDKMVVQNIPNKLKTKSKSSNINRPPSQSNIFSKYKKKLSKFSFNDFSLRIFMMIIDLFLIAHRSYKLFSDVKQLWRGRKSFLQYKCSNHYSPISNKDSIIVDESSFKQLRTKMAPWTKRQNLYCFNSFDVIMTIQFIILSIICVGLLICLASRESSIFMMPLIHSNSHSNSWWFLSYKIKVFRFKVQSPILKDKNEQRFQMWRQLLLLRENLTFIFNDNERNIISQYMWEQCYTERNYPNTTLWKEKNIHNSPNMPGYCQMPLPQSLVNYKSISCPFQKMNLFLYSYFIRRRKFKDKSFFIHIFRLYLVEIGYTALSITLIIFSLIGSLKTIKKLLTKHCIAESQMIVLLIPQLKESFHQSSLENSFLISDVNDPIVGKDCSKKSYSCYNKIDTPV